MKRTVKALIVLAAALTIFLFLPGAVYANESDEPLEATSFSYIVKEVSGVYSIADSTSDDLSELIRTAVPYGSYLIFDGISTDKTLYLEGNMRVGGVLNLGGGMVFEGESLTLDGITLTLGSPIRIKCGEVELASGSVSANSCSAVLLDYSSASSLTVSGGVMKSSSAALPTVSLTMGRVNVSGGEISNGLGTAISSCAELCISGTPRIKGAEFGVQTSVPIRLSYLGEYFNGELSLRYTSDFPEGSFTPVFFGASRLQCDKIKLYDSLKRQVTIEYFESSKYTDERKFIAVSRPFEALFYLDKEIYERCEYISGEIPTAPDDPSITGYVFDGWYTEREFINKYGFSEPLSSDIRLYAKTSLTSPGFKISSLTREYSGEEYRLAFSELSHPLSSLGSFSYDWYKDGEALNLSSPFVSVRNVSDSGEYICKLTFSYNGDYVTVVTPSVSVKISKMKVTMPIIEPAEYTGERLLPSLSDTALYTVRTEDGTDVGEYPVLLTLKDTDNCEWESGSGQTVALTFSVLRAQNRFLYASAADIYEGDAPKLNAEALFGEYRSYYSLDGVSFSEYLPTSPGRVYVKFAVTETLNYTFAESETVSFLINPLECVGIRIEKMPDKLVYYPFETPDLSGLSLTATMNSGAVRAVDNDAVAVIFKNGEYLSGVDRSVTLSYGGCTVPLPIEVLTLDYDLSGVIFSDTELIYDGNFHSIIPTLNVVGMDGSTPTFKVVGGGTDRGEYEVTLVFESDSPSYKTPSSICAKLTILPMPVTVEYGNTEFIYDGAQKLPSARFKNVSGLYIPVTLVGAAVDAGVYTAAAQSSDGNYRYINPSVEFTVAKRSFDYSEFVWSESEYVYSASEHRVELIRVPEGITVLGYTDSAFTDVGEYTATAMLIYDENNYNLPENVTLSWRITPAEYDMSNFFVLNTEVVYDGAEHFPNISGTLPSGLDGSVLSVAFSRSVKNVSDGCVVIRVDFSTSSRNYSAPSSVFVTLTVLPKPVSVIWSDTDFVYDGGAHIPSAIAAECGVSVSGYGTDAGEYIARAVSDDSNYRIVNAQFVFTVHKAENEWLIPPSVTDIYESGKLSPSASAKYGEVKFLYYLDEECETETELPTAPGEYYLKAVADGGNNYLSISSPPVSFKIIPVLPKEIVPDSLGEQTAMSRLPESFKITLINNDGSVRELSLSEVKVEYQSADGFRYGDTYMRISYKDVSKTVSVKVVRAKYDMSNAVWVGAHHTYDGTAKFAELTGLPEGVSVLSYSGNGAVIAGSYELGAVLSYDEVNYHKPTVPLCSLVIEKCKVEPPKIPSVTYDGKYHEPKIEESELYTVSFEGGINAGKYPVSVILTDPDNYVLDGEGAVFEILPIELTVRVMSDGKSYRIEEGKLLISDTLDEEFYTEGGLVYVRSNNGNYKLTVIPSSRAASANRIWLGIIIFLSVCLVSLTVVIIVKYPERLRMLGERLRFEMRKPQGEGKEARENYSTLLATDKEHADSMISDTTAKSLIAKCKERIITSGTLRAAVSVDAICSAFDDGSEVDINSLKEKGLIPENALRVHIVASGVMDKALYVSANSFELSAVKMIALTGGKAKRVRTSRK